MLLTGRARAAIEAHALECYPHESCGLVVGGEYVKCSNVADKASEHFAMPPTDYACAEDKGPLQAIVHSHPDACALPSIADMLACEASSVPVWLIVSVSRSHDGALAIGHLHQISAQAAADPPLIGTRFRHGSHDCYGLVRRYYRTAVGFNLPDFARSEQWWNDAACSLYVDNYEAAGFINAGLDSSLQTGDVLLMAIASRHGTPNHAAVYLGHDEILHHLWNQLSRREPLPRYRRYVTHVLRHREVLKWKR